MNPEKELDKELRREPAAPFRPLAEPTHPAHVRIFRDLVKVYRHIRKHHQDLIDDTFDSVSKRIGYVVTVALPVSFEVGGKGTVRDLRLDDDNLRGTLFDEGIVDALSGLTSLKDVSPGRHGIVAFWSDAVKLKLLRDWHEPAHELADVMTWYRPIPRDPPQRTPDASLGRGQLPAKDAMLLAAVNEVYPEFRLSERVGRAGVGTGVIAPKGDLRKQVMADVEEVLRRHGL